MEEGERDQGTDLVLFRIHDPFLRGRTQKWDPRAVYNYDPSQNLDPVIRTIVFGIKHFKRVGCLGHTKTRKKQERREENFLDGTHHWPMRR